MLFLLLLKALTLSCSFPPGHAFYLAVIQIDHQAGGDQARVTAKVFMDDLQNALRNFSAERFAVSPVEDSCEKNYALAAAYFSEHLSCRLDGQNLPLTLQDCRIEGDVFMLHFNMTCPPVWQKLAVKADLFMEIYPAQSNVVSILHEGERRYLRLKKGVETGVVEF